MALVVDLWVWVVYHLGIIAFIAIDLLAGFLRRHELTFKEATKWVVVWVGVGVSFGVFIIYLFGIEASAIYYAAYALEYTLSMDNLFVFAVIFLYFSVPNVAQPVVLYAGILGAIIMRASFIFAGLWLLETFHWMVIVFGAVLAYSGYRIWMSGTDKIEVARNPVVRWARRFLPITDRYHGPSFTVRGSKKLMFTPLIVVLLAIESTDLVFAFDSVPAAIALTRDFFIAYTANISAILGLRSLYFLIAHTMFKFKYVSKGLGLILVFLGAKFLLSAIDVHVPTVASLAAVFGVLATSMLASILVKSPKSEPAP